MDIDINNVLGDNIGKVNLVTSMGNDLSVVNSARVSYNKQSIKLSDKDEKLIQYLLEKNHSSPLEHVNFTFSITVPFFIERQWNRHRAWKYFSLNEISRRYTSENIEFYIPKDWREQHSDNKQMSTDKLVEREVALEFEDITKMFCEEAFSIYEAMIKHNVAREQARGILPQFMYTSFWASVDLHNLLWFLELRRHAHAQHEIQLYARAIESIIKEIVPHTYNIWNSIMQEKY